MTQGKLGTEQYGLGGRSKVKEVDKQAVETAVKKVVEILRELPTDEARMRILKAVMAFYGMEQLR